MTIFQNNFDGGTDGAGTTGAITTANSVNSGDAFSTITIGTPANCTFTYSATGARSGLGGRWVITAASTWRAYHSWTGVAQVAGRFVFTPNVVPTVATVIGGAINASIATAARFDINASGQFVVRDSAGAALSTTTAALSAGTAYVLEYQVAPGTTTSNGTIKAQLYTAANPGTLLINYSSTTANAGGATSTTIVRGQIGNNDSVSSLDITYDDIEYATGTLTPIGPPVVASGTWKGAFGLSVPAGSTISSTAVTVQHHESSLTDIVSVTGQLYIGSTPVGSATPFTVSATDRTDTVTVSSGIAQTDIPNLAIEVTSNAATTSAQQFIDYANCVVTYSSAAITGTGVLTDKKPSSVSSGAETFAGSGGLKVPLNKWGTATGKVTGKKPKTISSGSETFTGSGRIKAKKT